MDQGTAKAAAALTGILLDDLSQEGIRIRCCHGSLIARYGCDLSPWTWELLASLDRVHARAPRAVEAVVTRREAA